jgi:hypothetical protein
LKQPATNLLLTRDNRSDRTTCSKSDESNRSLQLVPTDLSRVVIVKSAASLLSELRQTCPQQTIFVLHVRTSFNKPAVGKQIENVSKEKNRTKSTLPTLLSHSIIAIGNIKCKSRIQYQAV